MGRGKGKRRGSKSRRRNGVVRVCKSEEEKKKSVYVDRKVFASFFTYRQPISWIQIDPHLYSGDLENHHRPDSNCFHVDGNPEINSPPSGLDVSNLLHYSTLVFDSKAYFIGGQYHNINGGGGGGGGGTNDDDFSDDDDYYFSDDDDTIVSGKMFIYHLLSNKWEESPSQLNIPRTSPTVVYVAAQKLIYVFGGRVTAACGPVNHNLLKKEHWIECFNFDPHHKSAAKWEFLPSASAPPDPVFEEFIPFYHFLYERGTQIVFFMQEAGFYSFNYVTQTWAAPFLSNLNLTEEARVKCFGVVVIDHLLFWHYLGVIYAYNLKDDRLVLSQVLDQLNMPFATPPPFPWYWPSPTFLERIGNDTLILVARNCDTEYMEDDLHLYKFQIQNLTHEEPPHGYNNNLHLVQIGFGVFFSPGNVLLNVLAV